MYGTIARVRLKEGLAEEDVRRVFDDVLNDRPEGSLGVFGMRSKEDPRVVWIGGAFESEEVYYRTAASPEQSARFAKLTELFEGEPEWHDGTFEQFVTF